MVHWCEFIISIIILIFAIWPTQIVSATSSMWIVVIAAALLLIHSFMHCKICCYHCKMDDGNMSRSVRAPARRKKRR
ncbi:MAG: hypothetical protein AABX48_03465 [Nanoarchaeota archaeon]